MTEPLLCKILNFVQLCLLCGQKEAVFYGSTIADPSLKDSWNILSKWLPQCQYCCTAWVAVQVGKSLVYGLASWWTGGAVWGGNIHLKLQFPWFCNYQCKRLGPSICTQWQGKQCQAPLVCRLQQMNQVPFLMLQKLKHNNFNQIL